MSGYFTRCFFCAGIVLALSTHALAQKNAQSSSEKTPVGRSEERQTSTPTATKPKDSASEELPSDRGLDFSPNVSIDGAKAGRGPRTAPLIDPGGLKTSR
jgi:hypothetical protein